MTVKYVEYTRWMERNIEEVNEKAETLPDWAQVDKWYVTPPFVIRNMSEEEKLVGSKNFKTRLQMVRLDLTALNLLAFIKKAPTDRLPK